MQKKKYGLSQRINSVDSVRVYSSAYEAYLHTVKISHCTSAEIHDMSYRDYCRMHTTDMFYAVGKISNEEIFPVCRVLLALCVKKRYTVDRR